MTDRSWPSAADAVDQGPAPPSGGAGPACAARVDLGRVLAGLRHLDASVEPAQVFAGLAAVCVPALCDECLIQLTENGGRPYRIRRTDPGCGPRRDHQRRGIHRHRRFRRPAP